jgi:hypothetical protein
MDTRAFIVTIQQTRRYPWQKRTARSIELRAENMSHLVCKMRTENLLRANEVILSICENETVQEVTQ